MAIFCASVIFWLSLANTIMFVHFARGGYIYEPNEVIVIIEAIISAIIALTALTYAIIRAIKSFKGSTKDVRPKDC